MAGSHEQLTRKHFSGRIPELDGIRGIAILLVLICHYWVGTIKSDPNSMVSHLTRRLSLTWSGVDLFFVLSGFLIAGILIDNRHARNYFSAFYVRRMCRIFPLYFFWLFLFVVLGLATRGQTQTAYNSLFHVPSPLPLWSYATFTQNIFMFTRRTYGAGWLGITWSLAIEEQFYLLLPLMLWLVPAKKVPYVLAILILLAPLLRLFFLNFHPHFDFSIYLMPSRSDALLLGVAGAYMVRNERALRSLSENRTLLYIALGILLSGVALLTLIQSSPSSESMTYLGYSWLALLYFCFLLIAVTESRGIVSAITRNVWLRRMGRLAYGLYIYHLAILWLTHGLVLNQEPQTANRTDLLVTLIALVLTFVVSYLSWAIFEKRFIAWGHLFKYDYREISKETPTNSLLPEIEVPHVR